MDYYANDSLGAWTVNNKLHWPVKGQRKHITVESEKVSEHAERSQFLHMYVLSVEQFCSGVNYDNILSFLARDDHTVHVGQGCGLGLDAPIYRLSFIPCPALDLQLMGDHLCG